MKCGVNSRVDEDIWGTRSWSRSYGRIDWWGRRGRVTLVEGLPGLTASGVDLTPSAEFTKPLGGVEKRQHVRRWKGTSSKVSGFWYRHRGFSTKRVQGFREGANEKAEAGQVERERACMVKIAREGATASSHLLPPSHISPSLSMADLASPSSSHSGPMHPCYRHGLKDKEFQSLFQKGIPNAERDLPVALLISRAYFSWNVPCPALCITAVLSQTTKSPGLCHSTLSTYLSWMAWPSNFSISSVPCCSGTLS